MGGDALELALALHRAPGRRLALRDRPLPENIGLAIKLASAPEPLLQDAAQRVGEPETLLLEAVRFYLQQVLFEPGADAYRTLGVTADAPTPQIRENFHWLQRWLHPDRHGAEDWEALFASRINQAWRQLRNEADRRAYDSLPKAPAVRATDRPGPVELIWTAAPDSTPSMRAAVHWPQRIGLVTLVGSCLVLFYLAATRTGPKSPDLDRTTVVTSTATTVAAPVPVARPSTPRAKLAAPIHERVAMAERVKTLSKPTARHHARPAPHNDPAIASATVAVTVVPRDRIPVVAPLRALSEPSATTTSDVDRGRRREGVVRKSATSHLGVAPIQTAAHSAVAPHPAMRAATSPAMPPEPSPSASETIVRFDSARARLREIVTYFRAEGGQPLAWPTAGASGMLRDTRVALRERIGSSSAAGFQLDAPDWHLSGNVAALRASYHVRQAQHASESGHLTLDMLWRNRAWQITHVALEPAR